MTLDDVYRETILEHSQSPHNKRQLANADGQARGYNPLCGDDITVYVRLDADRVAEATYTGRSCSICEASASMLTDAVTGRTVEEAERLIEAVRESLKSKPNEEFAGLPPDAPPDLEALQGVRRLPVRVKCAMLSWNALQQALAQATRGAT